MRSSSVCKEEFAQSVRAIAPAWLTFRHETARVLWPSPLDGAAIWLDINANTNINVNNPSPNADVKDANIAAINPNLNIHKKHYLKGIY